MVQHYHYRGNATQSIYEFQPSHDCLYRSERAAHASQSFLEFVWEAASGKFY
jgi:hypothetical protein